MTNGEHDHTGATPCRACDQLWRTAVSLKALGMLGARWLEGEIEGFPGGGYGTPDDETSGIAAALAAMNRAGYWTENSQPGEADGAGAQRATVSGYCTEETANMLQAGLLDTELVVLAAPTMASSPFQVPVTREGRAEWTWAGYHGDGEEIDDPFAACLNDAAVEALTRSWFVEVIDMQWGRNDLLWNAVVDALTNPRVREVVDRSNVRQGEPGLLALTETEASERARHPRNGTASTQSPSSFTNPSES